MSTYRVGIDLGTSNTVCAVIHKEMDTPEVIKITHQESDFTLDGRGRSELLPSALCINDDNEVFVGEIARTLQRYAYAKTFVSTKRFMGTDWRKMIDGEKWTPELVAGCILKVVRLELLTRFQNLPELTVITVPASFGTEARRCTLKASKMAGFENVQLFDEPTAALLDALLSNPKQWTEQGPSTHMVVDIGGGTLDVSLLEMEWSQGILKFDIIGRSRFNELAGDDFDLSIAGFLMHKWEENFGVRFSDYNEEDRENNRIRRASVEQKLFCGTLLKVAKDIKGSIAELMQKTPRREWPTLSEQVIPFNTPAGEWSYQFTVDDLLTALLEYFKDTQDSEEKTEEFSFFRAIHQCLESASSIRGYPITLQDITQVWLAGGSAQLPIVGEAIQRMTYNRPLLVPRCMQAIALGAARYAQFVDSQKIVITERMFDGIYLQTEKRKFLCLIAPQDRTPAEFTYQNLLKLPAAGDGIMVKTFSGYSVEISSGDSKSTLPNLQPFAQRYVKFETILPQGQMISVRCKVSRNRDIELEFITTYKSQEYKGRVGIVVSDDTKLYEDDVIHLPEINLM